MKNAGNHNSAKIRGDRNLIFIQQQSDKDLIFEYSNDDHDGYENDNDDDNDVDVHDNDGDDEIFCFPEAPSNTEGQPWTTQDFHFSSFVNYSMYFHTSITIDSWMSFHVPYSRLSSYMFCACFRNQ